MATIAKLKAVRIINQKKIKSLLKVKCVFQYKDQNSHRHLFNN